MICLGLGSNLGNRLDYLMQALLMLEKKFGKVILFSSVYETQGWGVDNHPDYLNAVLCFNSSVPHMEVMPVLSSIEKALGRKRSAGAILPRTIDIDLLFYDKLIINTPEIIIPHPRIKYRKFVLWPLCEIMGDFIHPVYQLPVTDLLDQCEDAQKITKTDYCLRPHEL